jgi:pilus biogenesis lipoprotein CpaD
MNANKNQIKGGARRKMIGVALLVGLAGLAGCESMEKADRYLDRQWAAPSNMMSPDEMAIHVRRDDTSATVTYAPRNAALSAWERESLERFVARSGAVRGDRAVVALSTEGGRGLAERRVQAIARELHRRGIGVTRSFGPGEPDVATVTISRMVAVAPDCPQWKDLMQRNTVDEYKPKFGCLTASSLATSVHRPLDLVSGRPGGRTDGVIAAKGVEMLREGKFDPPITSAGTGSPQSQQGQQAK